MKEGLPYDVAVKPHTFMDMHGQKLYGWSCRTCGKMYLVQRREGIDSRKHLAESCCATTKKCVRCRMVMDASVLYSLCTLCRAQVKWERYGRLEQKEWDGVTPLVEYDADEYFYDADQVMDHLIESGIGPFDSMFVICEHPAPHSFSAEDYFHDVLPEDWEMADCGVDVKALDKAVNDAAELLAKKTWVASKFRPTLESLLKHVDWEGEE